MNPFSFPARALLIAELKAHPGKTLLGAFVIAIGVSMGYAIHIINRSALDEFSQAMRSLSGNADLQIRGPRSGFDENLYPKIAKLSEVAAISPIVEIEAKVPGQKETLRILGMDIFRASAVQPNLIGSPEKPSASEDRESPPAFLDSNAIFLSPAAQRAFNADPGKTIEVQTGLQILRLRVAGTLQNAGAGLKIATMDIGAAQWRFNRLGTLSRMDLKLRQGVNVEKFRAQLAELLPAGVSAVTPVENETRASNLSRAYRVNLNVLALVALFTGAFLILSSQALSVVRRRGELALLRVIGFARAEIVLLLLLEGTLVGAIGSSLGLLGGYVVADVVLANFGGDLGGGYFSGVNPSVRFDPLAAAVFFLIGIASTVLGCIAPAWEAANAKPARALKAGDEESALVKVRSPWRGLLFIAVGLALTQMGPIAELPLPGYAAVVLLIIGGISLVPSLAQAFFSRFWKVSSRPGEFRTMFQLALAQLAGAPGRASLAMSGIVVSFSLMVAMAIMVASLRGSVDQWLTHLLPADLYVRTTASGDSAFFSPEDVARITNAPGVAQAEFLRTNLLLLDPQRPPVTLISRKIDASNPSARIPIIGHDVPTHEPRSEQPLPSPVGGRGAGGEGSSTGTIRPRNERLESLLPDGLPPVWVSEAMVDIYGFHAGKTIQLPLAGKHVDCRVAGIWRDYGRQHGSIVMRDTDYRTLTGDNTVSDGAIWLAPGYSSTQLVATLRTKLSDGGRLLEISEPGQIRAISMNIFDRTFAVTYLLESVAIVIGLAGVAASFGAQVLARSREFGMLRHLGVTRTQIGVILATEGGLLALTGIVAGLAMGWVVSLILIHVINPQSFHWKMETQVPWLLLAAVGITLFLASGITAVLTGRRAMSRSAIMAVRDDW